MPDPADPYAPPPPPFWVRRSQGTVAVVVGLATAVATTVSFPPFHASELAYGFAAPAILWAYRRPRLRLYAGTLGAAQIAAWLALLVWLRHVTVVGWLILGALVGVWVGVWYLAVWWTMPRMVGRSAPVRLSMQAGLAGLWVVIEWTRTWLLTGFPWLPLSASQWQVPSVLQIASYTGAWGVSFVLIMVNIGFAAYAHRLFFEQRKGFNKRSQEFLLALFLLLVCLCVQVTEIAGRAERAQPFARVAFVQPDIPQSVKWQPGEGAHIVRVLRRLTTLAGRTAPDLILWPESAFPWPAEGDPQARALVEDISKQAGAPILFGTNAVTYGGTAGERWYDAACLVTPQDGLDPHYYAKRHLVPFGEYIPWRFLFGWLSKVVPIGSDFSTGTAPTLLMVPMRSGEAAMGPLVCYEDVFPNLARESVLAGADALVVLTNDAWYGQEGAAYQHAAHSVLRAVELRRPVLRCGNAGWSGWIDEYGGMGTDRDPHVLTSDEHGVYFRGTRTLDVVRDPKWIGRESFYCVHGDWFVLVSALIAAFAYALALTAPADRKPRG
ncbi:MAG: apolipoprotein N-acyltransferase [Opitutaceae bacterium]